jgi:hypothetical protein
MMQVYEQLYVPQTMIAPTDVVDFMDGLVFGLLQKEDLPEIQKCLQHAPDIAKQITAAVEDFEKGDFADIIAGIGEIGQIVQDLPNDFKDCDGMDGDLKRIEKWGKIFTDPLKLIQTLTTNVVSNFAKITQDIASIPDDFNNKKFKNAGEDIADIMLQAIGPVP